MTDDYDEFTKRMTSFDLILDEDVPLAQSDTELDIALSHYGVKGMKWGQRKVEVGAVVLKKQCKNGTELTVREKPQGRIMKYLSSKSSAIAEMEATYHEFTFHDKSGKKVGQGVFEQTSPTALGLEWIGINKKDRSNGYARAALEGVMEYAKNNGIEELNLTATDMGAPLYKSLGFKDLGHSEYQYKLPPSIQHAGDAPIDLLAEYIAASLDRYTEAELAKDLDFKSGSKKGGEDTVTHNDADDFLAHYGVKGMKWGRRRTDAELAGAAEAKAAKKAAKAEAKQTAKKEAWKKPVDEDAATAGASRKRTETHGTDALSNKELQALVTRMNLEQQYANLQSSGKAKTARQAGTEYVSDILKDVGREILSEVVKSAVKKAATSAYKQASASASNSARNRSSTRVPSRQIEAARRAIGR